MSTCLDYKYCLIAIIFIFAGCRHSLESEYFSFIGETMGTYYKVTCNCHSEKSLRLQIDLLLADINHEVSTYIPESFISQVNATMDTTTFVNLPKHFRVNAERAFDFYELTSGYLDVSVMPLVNYWGFGYTPKRAVVPRDSATIDSITQFVGLGKWYLSNDTLVKKLKNQQLDFSALAKGYAVDQIGEMLMNADCEHFLVDIGGELVASGLNDKGRPWVVGVSVPKSEADITEVQLLLQLSDRALATSGNYRIFHEVEGVKYGHTINPISGFPYQDQLLSVSIIADKCIDADAIATSCMAMGYEKAITFVQKLPDISACFLIGAEDGTIQTKFENGFIHYVLSE